MRRFFLIIFFVFISAVNVFCQEKDTIWVQGKSVLILGDTSLYIDEDTTVILPDTIASFLKRDTLPRGSRFYKRIKKALSKNAFTTEIYNLLFDDPDKHFQRKSNPKIVNNYATFPVHAGKIINKVKITKLAVFGTEITDTTEFKKDSWLLRRGNQIHSYTRSNVIRNHLFFNEGELLDPVTLEDSERVLRSLPYIKDARVLVEPVGADAVNIVVVVKDNWSLYPEVEILNLDRWRLQIADRNFFGLGHEFINELLYDSRDIPKYGYRGMYRIRDIGHSFINAEVSYAESDDYATRGFRVFRDYVTPEIELAGGVEFKTDKHNIVRVLPDTVIDFDMKFQYQDVYLSHAYPVGSILKRKRLVTGGRYRKYDYIDQPEVKPDSNYHYFDRHQYLFNIGLSKRNYERSSLIYGYGRTEDIPDGYLLSFTIGKEYNQFYDRWYSAFDYAIGGYLGRIGYLRPSIAIGTFFRNNKLEQSMFRGELAYFSNLYYIRKFALRQFFYGNYTYGFNRFGNDFIDINDRNGVRGLSSLEFLGEKKVVLRSETVTFTPFYLIGFRMAIFGFIDVAAIQEEDKNIFSSRMYHGFGLGLRLRNENLAIKSISIRLGYYPNAPQDAVPYDINMSGNPFFQYMDFIVTPPEVMEFR